jgi:hypothetical protein
MWSAEKAAHGMTLKMRPKTLGRLHPSTTFLHRRPILSYMKHNMISFCFFVTRQSNSMPFGTVVHLPTSALSNGICRTDWTSLLDFFSISRSKLKYYRSYASLVPKSGNNCPVILAFWYVLIGMVERIPIVPEPSVIAIRCGTVRSPSTENLIRNNWNLGVGSRDLLISVRATVIRQELFQATS